MAYIYQRNSALRDRRHYGDAPPPPSFAVLVPSSGFAGFRFPPDVILQSISPREWEVAFVDVPVVPMEDGTVQTDDVARIRGAYLALVRGEPANS